MWLFGTKKGGIISFLAVRAALIQEYAEEVEIKLNVTDDFETCARKILQLYKSNRINYSAPVAVTFKGEIFIYIVNWCDFQSQVHVYAPLVKSGSTIFINDLL